MKLNGKQKQALYNALLSAFPTRGSLAQMMVFQMDENLEKVAGGETYSDLVLSLIQWADSQGLLEKLMVGARAQNSGNRDLLAFAVEVSVESPPEQPQDEEQDEKPDSGASPILERIISKSPEEPAVNIESLASLYRRARRASRAVCRIEAYQYMATGFLVAPDVLMTAYFVMQDLIEDAAYVDPTTKDETPLKPSNVAFRFGYEQIDDSATIQQGQIYYLAQDWLIASSPLGELNFALLRLDGSPGLDTVDGDKWTVERGWIKPAATPNLASGSLLYILHHPSAMPLKFSSGTLLGPSKISSRCVYDIFTAAGSSGAPCFNAEWEVLGMHEWEVPAMHEGREMSNADAKLKPQNLRSGVLVSEIFKRADVQAALKL